ncbi:MAG: PstS family phosphate ABC transporter substrate-binding protein [Symploca sp. SIO2B6]|nr:PstS family phosphate ABC transporter substrate-binding protein [Symploca sp. SIO2B6]
MQITKNLNAFTLIKSAMFAGAIALLSSCSEGTSDQPQTIRIDGSSTVYPITQAVAKEFNAKNKVPAQVTVDFSGTGGGFEKFCAGETDINDASRPIQLDEMEKCKAEGVAYIELPVAFDALSVVVNSQNNWASDITLAELKKIWEPQAQGKITNWNQVRASWPDKPLNLYGPGTDSGTYDYFTEAIVGKAGASRSDFFDSEDDDILVEEISEDPNAIGYFGLAYYEANPGQMKPLAISNGNALVLPSVETVENATYQPLSRPLFIYVNLGSAKDNPAVREFVYYYLEKAPEIVSTVGYVPLPKEGYHLNKVHYNQGKVGSVFEGKSQFNLTIGELLRKQAKY